MTVILARPQVLVGGIVFGDVVPPKVAALAVFVIDVVMTGLGVGVRCTVLPVAAPLKDATDG